MLPTHLLTYLPLVLLFLFISIHWNVTAYRIKFFSHSIYLKGFISLTHEKYLKYNFRYNPLHEKKRKTMLKFLGVNKLDTFKNLHDIKNSILSERKKIFSDSFDFILLLP